MGIGRGSLLVCVVVEENPSLNAYSMSTLKTGCNWETNILSDRLKLCYLKKGNILHYQIADILYFLSSSLFSPNTIEKLNTSSVNKASISSCTLTYGTSGRFLKILASGFSFSWRTQRHTEKKTQAPKFLNFQ